ncbi:hypothetical protein IHE49_12830 [Rhodanobacter sp. 7MK24]|uniref:hypothetical protein n=1 Tax=Rhodanobacter sp. 7MK24 TaxID=2775922 RepID=UPI0017857FAD|nr:hypothetical protein [Rhodanobacter sp. 7MK24]MBD8881369.1 hypothetical protein [Rhodanobacter sp. 7MK24]
MKTKKTGGRKLGDKNHSLREERLIAENEKLKADIAVQRAKVKIKDARMKELRASLAAEKKKGATEK